MLNIVDFSVGGFPLLVVGFLELVAVNWIYGMFFIYYFNPKIAVIFHVHLSTDKILVFLIHNHLIFLNSQYLELLKSEFVICAHGFLK